PAATRCSPTASWSATASSRSRRSATGARTPSGSWPGWTRCTTRATATTSGPRPRAERGRVMATPTPNLLATTYDGNVTVGAQWQFIPGYGQFTITAYSGQTVLGSGPGFGSQGSI